MKPTKAQYFFAKGCWIQIVLGPFMIGLPLLTAAVVLSTIVPTLEPLSQMWNLLRLAFWIVISLVLGFLLAILVCVFLAEILQPFIRIRERKNGAPFREGDIVRILSGRHRDRVVRIYDSSWYGNGVVRAAMRVDLGEKEREEFKDVFEPWKLFRVGDAPPPPESDTDDRHE